LLDPFIRPTNGKSGTKDTFLLDQCGLERLVELLSRTKSVDEATKAWSSALGARRKAKTRGNGKDKLPLTHYIDNKLKTLRKLETTTSLASSGRKRRADASSIGDICGASKQARRACGDAVPVVPSPPAGAMVPSPTSHGSPPASRWEASEDTEFAELLNFDDADVVDFAGIQLLGGT